MARIRKVSASELAILLEKIDEIVPTIHGLADRASSHGFEEVADLDELVTMIALATAASRLSGYMAASIARERRREMSI